MAGIYIHIPFCRKKCHYCNFFSVATTRWREDFLKALLKEITIRKDYLGDEDVSTIYLGGGTPSLLELSELSSIFEQLHRCFHISGDAEITLEANPDDIDEKKAREWKTTPINRLSVGIQSFFDDDLQYLNRVHSAEQAFKALDTVKNAGLNNLTIDLIYGIPTLTEVKWLKNIEIFFKMDIDHLSAYSLTVEKRTALELLIRKGKYVAPDEQQSVNHFKILLEQAGLNGFIHYEISNFAREGHYSKHNSLYWLGGNYLGLGPSAHSFNGTSRQWNVSNINRYIMLDDIHTSVEEKEILTLPQRYNEYVMTSLRTVWGCDTQHIRNVFGENYEKYLTSKAEGFIKKGHLRRAGTKFFLTDEGKLFADGIAAELFGGEDLTPV